MTAWLPANAVTAPGDAVEVPEPAGPMTAACPANAGFALAALISHRVRACRDEGTEQTSGDRQPACDRRDPADQADSGAPLTAQRPVPTLLPPDLNLDSKKKRNGRAGRGHDRALLSAPPLSGVPPPARRAR